MRSTVRAVPPTVPDLFMNSKLPIYPEVGQRQAGKTTRWDAVDQSAGWVVRGIPGVAGIGYGKSAMSGCRRGRRVLPLVAIFRALRPTALHELDRRDLLS